MNYMVCWNPLVLRMSRSRLYSRSISIIHGTDQGISGLSKPIRMWDEPPVLNMYEGLSIIPLSVNTTIDIMRAKSGQKWISF